MQSFPANVYSVASVREMDRIAIEEQGIPGYTLMQRAAAAALNDACHTFPDAKRWQVVCGGGNNGGDGYVLGTLAARDGVDVSVISMTDPGSLTGDAATAYSDFSKAGGSATSWTGSLDTRAELLVDAILGSGLERAVSGDFGAAVEAMNAHTAPVHALDIATGINGDNGAIMGCAVKADLTTTFVALKPGLFLGEGPNYCGRVTFAGLGIDASAAKGLEVLFRRVQPDRIRRHLPRRSRGAHKGNFGHVLVVGGGPGMPGAVRLCGEAALRTGAGRVSVATHPEHAAVVASGCPELMCRAIATDGDLADMLSRADVIAFGPGLGQSDWAERLYSVVSRQPQASVWDADALNLLARHPTPSATRILTPHPGEAATLLAVGTDKIQADRPAALARLKQKYGGVVVLKGAGTLTSASNGAPWLSTSGNPGMAAPGMGDVLTGVTAALLAQGIGPEEAAALGVELHALAGDRAAHGGERGMLASDLIAALRPLVTP